MTKAILLLLPLLSACGGGGGDGNQTEQRGSRPAVQTAELTGLYQGRGEGGERDRLCMISEENGGGAAFGIVTEDPDGSSCGGAGRAVRENGVLRLTMTGDEQCAIEARIDGRQVTFPAAVPEGCAYYCGPGATLADLSFEKTGGTAEDAKRATDLAGGPLCG
jgi:hypothetical protein